MSESFSPALSGRSAGIPAPLVIILLGPPGAGKGTQAKMLGTQLQLPHISTGDLLRDHIRKGTDLGKEARTFIDKGHLVPDPLILDVLFDRIREEDCSRGYILDGFPRTIRQAENLQHRLGDSAVPIVINLNLSDLKIIERLSNRVICDRCGTPYHLIYSPPKIRDICDMCSGTLIQRQDDSEPVVKKRLKVYHEQTAPLIAFYEKQKMLHTVDCSADIQTVFNEILKNCCVDKK